MSAPVKVIFRKFTKGGDIIALFPACAGTMNVMTCSSYQHVGQHGAASVSLMWHGTTPAKREEYRPLLQELRRIGYKKLIIMKRFTHSDKRAREEQLKG